MRSAFVGPRSIHSRLEVFLALLLLLLPYRLSGGRVRLPRGLVLGLQLSEHFVQRSPRYLATESGRELIQRSGGVLYARRRQP
jgi:hypothetical protein